MSELRINRAQGIDLEDLDVVVVDDSKPMQTIVRSMLNAARVHRVRTFDRAGEAYRSMLVEPPHVLITDWNLPDTDGLALVRSMRDPRSGPLAGVPVIMITAHATRRLVERAIAEGIHFVLAKPLSPSSVLKRIEALGRDERRFRFDHERGRYVLDGVDELLAGQRRRWRELQDHVADAAARNRTAVPERPVAPATPVTAGPGVAPKPSVRVAHDDRRRAAGLGVALRANPGETSTGQPAS